MVHAPVTPPPGRRISAPAQPCHLAADGGRDTLERLERDEHLEGQADRKEDEDERRRATRKMDRTAAAVTTTVTMSATAVDSTAGHSMTTVVVTTVATVAATKDLACSARHRRARQLWPLT